MVDIFPKKKKWWQYAPSENLSTKEQIEICVLIALMIVFVVVWYHFYINTPRFEQVRNSRDYKIWQLEQKIQKIEGQLK